MADVKISEATNVDAVQIEKQGSVRAEPPASQAEIYGLTDDTLHYFPNGGTDSVIVRETTTHTLTNKTIEPNNNTINGDHLDITFTPANYTPDATPAEADDVDDLAAHLKGIDDALGIAAPFLGWDIYLRDEKTSGTNGGTSTSATTHTRVLNTEVFDVNNNCTLSSNQFTLDAGTYDIMAFAPAYNNAGRTKLRLYNVSDAVYTLEGHSGAVAASSQDTLSLRGRFTIASTKTLELRHYFEVGFATQGLGLANSQGTEIYAEVLLKKVA